LTVLAYWGVWNCQFLGYDDPDYFTRNKHVQAGLSWPGIVWAFTTGDAANWHPLTWLSLMLDASVFGTGPAAPHAVNLLLHVVDTVLLFHLFRRLTGALWRSFWVAALFGLHPMHVESVAWVAERKDVLSALFFFLTLLAYARYADPGRSFVRHVWYGLALGLFALGLMSKPMLVTVPFVLLLLDWWPLQRINFPLASFANARLLLDKIPFLVLSVASSAVTFLAQQQGGAVAKLTQYGLAGRLENIFVSYGRYLEKTFTAGNLAVPYPLVPRWPVELVVLNLFILLAGSGAALWLARRQRFVLTGWLWFLGMLVPVVGLVQVGSAAMADRYHYLPSIGIFILLAWGGCVIRQKWRSIDSEILKLAGFSLLVLLVWRTQWQSRYWRNDGTLFTHALAVTKDNFVAQILYGGWLSRNGDAAGALEQYNQAWELDPTDCTALYNMGNGYAKLGYWDRAIDCYQGALKMKPDQPDVLNNLGFALAASQRLPEAVAAIQQALRLNPDYGDAHNNLASILYRQGDFIGAATHFYAAAKLMPDNARIQVNLGDTLLHLNEPDNAAASYRRALELEPGNERARTKLNVLTRPR
jgi:Flp pilus assembly protein TadD